MGHAPYLNGILFESFSFSMQININISIGLFYVCGGEGFINNVPTLFDRCDAFDPIKNQWIETAKLSLPRHGIYVICKDLFFYEKIKLYFLWIAYCCW